MPTTTSSQKSSTITTSTTSTSATPSFSKSFSLQANYCLSLLRQSSIIQMIYPKIDSKRHSPSSNKNEQLALGRTLKMLITLVLQNDFTSVEFQK